MTHDIPVPASELQSRTLSYLHEAPPVLAAAPDVELADGPEGVQALADEFRERRWERVGTKD